MAPPEAVSLIYAAGRDMTLAEAYAALPSLKADAAILRKRVAANLRAALKQIEKVQ